MSHRCPCHRGSLRLLVLLAGILLFGCGGSTEPGGGLSISTGFEGASLGQWRLLAGDTVEISIRRDTNAPHGFWFAFEVEDAGGRDLVFRVEDDASLYGPGAWTARQPVASPDGGETWSRIREADFAGGRFTFRHRPASDRERIALTLPYPLTRWLELLGTLSEHPRVRSVEVLGESLRGRPVHLVEVGDGSTADAVKSQVWALGRQHPGEPEGSYMLEGFLAWLLGADPEAARMLGEARILLVPFLNPDGVVVGNQRVNLAGLDLNRQWHAPATETSPTILATRDRILATRGEGEGVRVVLDFHGAPPTRASFFYYNDRPSLPAPLYDEMGALMEKAIELNGDFAPLERSAGRAVGGGERARSWAYAALGTHGLTVEASGIDAPYGPYAEEPMTEARYRALGEAVARAVAAVLYDD